MGDKPLALFLLWGVSLLMSFGLRFWGQHHRDPLPVDGITVTVLLFGPALLLLGWLLKGWADGERE
ncbi:MAG: hypothetical protein ACON4T_05415 [Synechococcus sp.]